MRKILVCQHVAHEILGTLNPLFKQSGFRIKYVNFGRHPNQKPDITGYNGLVVLGGPMSVYQTTEFGHLKTEIALIQKAIALNIPILGICLGAQLVARALGAKVYANSVKEIGWYDVILTKEGKKDPVLNNFGWSEKIFQWHGDTFDLPRNTVHLASSRTCRHQAFRYRDNVYAFQFHLEVDEPMIERWLKVPANKQELKSLKGRFNPNHIRSLTPHHIDRLKDLSNTTFQSFIDLFGIPKKTRRLPSK